MSHPAGSEPLPTPHPGVAFQAMPDGAVLLSTEEEVYYGLNVAGARIWELLSATTTLAELCAELADDFPDVPVAELRADAVELLERLEAARLVVPATGDAEG